MKNLPDNLQILEPATSLFWTTPILSRITLRPTLEKHGAWNTDLPPKAACLASRKFWPLLGACYCHGGIFLNKIGAVDCNFGEKNPKKIHKMEKMRKQEKMVLPITLMNIVSSSYRGVKVLPKKANTCISSMGFNVFLLTPQSLIW